MPKVHCEILMVSYPGDLIDPDELGDSMTEPIVIELGYIPPAEVRGNSRAHWTMKRVIATNLRISGSDHALVERQSITRPFQKARITFAFHHWRKIDLDNLAIGMKPFVDGLGKRHREQTSLLVDDDPDHVIYGSHSFTKCKKGESKTIVTIEELE